MSARVLSELAARPEPSKREVQRAIEKKFRELGYLDASCGRPRAKREWLLKIGGELAVHYYFQGFRCGKRIA